MDIRFRGLERREAIPGRRGVGALKGAGSVIHTVANSRAAASALLLALALFSTVPPLFIAGVGHEVPLLYRVGQKAALTAFGLLCMQIVLAARLGFADRALGLGAIIRFHRAVGVVVLVLLLAHPALLLLSIHGGIPWRWDVVFGVGALVILLAGVLAALLLRFLRLDYNSWRHTHRWMSLAVVLGSIHGRAVGQDLQSAGVARVWWASVLLLGLGAFAWRNLCAPRWGRRRFRVESVTPEARGIWTLKLSPVDGALFRHLPGQFVFLTLLRAGLPAEEHPFTISSSPSQVGFIAATIKELGNYTRTVGLTRAGDGALVEGPFGRFCHLHHDAERFLFISGGVGCTPVASMLRFMRDTVDHRQALYLCANRTEVDIAFREEFDRLPASMKVVHVLSDPGPGWRGARGRLDAATLQRLAGAALARADVLLCGPTQFMAALRGSLRGLGVPSGRIHTERFTVR